MKTWERYPNSKKALRKEKYIVVVPESYDESDKQMPLFCEVCGIRFGSKEDEISYNEFKCCSPCADMWAYSNFKKWKSGWRPQEELVQSFVDKRSFANPDLFFE